MVKERLQRLPSQPPVSTTSTADITNGGDRARTPATTSTAAAT